ncbi:MAG: hypothetical protein LVR00_01335 [Rhabdochlamydiaceae bacterium]|jgi:2-oxoglutarate dehydrogenase E1 component
MNGLSFSNLEWLDGLYQKYLVDPTSVEGVWQQFFSGWELALSLAPQRGGGEVKIDHLIQSYRVYGHLAAEINPLKVVAAEKIPELSLEGHGLSTSDLQELFPTCGLLEEERAPLAMILGKLQKIYTSSLGIEYMGMGNSQLEKWVQEKLEGSRPPTLSVRREEKHFAGFEQSRAL